eukprot:TRINITY_DN3413_c0_g1_i4.p1 TRINITY_DN3413_c0_g1~~TRINITY_DN3413_c0_g1_i4.p1  ORF type:complete len:135 (+),score=11.63 TRINITY_DN3413_c0_g1_i4:233-637(+)
MSSRRHVEALYNAVESNNLDLVKETLTENRVDVNGVWGPLDRTALHVASSQGNAPICKLLLKHKASPTKRDCMSDPKHIRKWRPLDYAVWNGNAEIVSLLLSYCPADEITIGDWRWTPLISCNKASGPDASITC